jgi:hypothetical protein
MKQLSKHLNFANAISCLALFVALSGAAYAAKATLGNKAVKTRNLANGSVNTLKLRNGAVTPLKIRNGAVTGAKIAPGAVASTQIADGAVRSAQIRGGAVNQGKLKENSVSNDKIVNAAVTAAKLAPQSVTAGKLAPQSVGAATLTTELFSQLVKYVSYPAAGSAFDEASSKSAIVECPVRKQVIGGGARITGPEESAVIVDSSPSVAGPNGTRIGWVAAARALSPTPGKSWAIEAWAICAEF